MRVYVAIRNNTGSDLTGTVEFFDNGQQIGRKTVQALDGRIIESWADWEANYGDHTLTATLSRIELHTIGESTQEVEVISALAEDMIFVDYDTDKDGIGNTEDQDDDGDNISDAQEEEDGTDPLVKNAPKEEKPEETQETKRSEEEELEETPTTSRGLERYLTDSPAENMLSGVTTYIHDLKEDLDAYRSSRTAHTPEQNSASSTNAVNADGFGEAVRSSSTNAGTGSANQFNLPDFMKSMWGLITALFSTVFTFLLTALSWLLGHPVLIQVGLLALVLITLIKLAHKFGSRPKSKKL